MNNKRIARVDTLHRDGNTWETSIQTVDGSEYGLIGRMPNQVEVTALGGTPAPAPMLNFSIRMDNDATEYLRKRPGHYAERIANMKGASQLDDPMTILSARRCGVDGTLDSNRALLGEGQQGEASMMVVQPGADATFEEALDWTWTLRDEQDAADPEHYVDVVPGLPLPRCSADDLASVADEEPVLFLDLHGVREQVLGIARDFNSLLAEKQTLPWVGALQVKDWTMHRLLTSVPLNLSGVMACSGFLGSRPPNKDSMPSPVDLVNNKTWPVRGSARGLPRSSLPAGARPLSPRYSSLDVTNDMAVDALGDDAFKMYRTSTLMAGILEAQDLVQKIRDGAVADFIAARPELRSA